MIASEIGNGYWTCLLEKRSTGLHIWVGDWRGIPLPMVALVDREDKGHLYAHLIPTASDGSNYVVYRVDKVLQKDEAKPYRDALALKNSQKQTSTDVDVESKSDRNFES